ncbi:MAG: chemotaxis-specific protein-glutamate methyltransferase CheB [Candidatus Saccharibacteria bacterium]
MEKLKALIVDDSLTYRKILADAVEATGLAVVEQTASNGALALERLSQKSFDVALIDVFMPEMDGLETLVAIKRDHPQVTVVMVSGGSPDNAAITMKALQNGAMDFVLKPAEADGQKSMEKIKNHLRVLFAQLQIKKHSQPGGTGVQPRMMERPLTAPAQSASSAPVRTTSAAGAALNGVDLVVVASSTGGPQSLDVFCRGLQSGLNAPVLIVQHMPPDFTRLLAQALDGKCALTVSEGQAGDIIENRHVYIAPGGRHMTVRNPDGSRRVIEIIDTEPVNGVRPAADVLFESVARAYEGKRVLAVVLTGMGSDGKNGIELIKRKCKCYCITQSEGTCVVYGMPKSVYDAGLSDEVADLQNISARVMDIAAGRS